MEYIIALVACLIIGITTAVIATLASKCQFLTIKNEILSFHLEECENLIESLTTDSEVQ